jgi:hypothetical protein
MRHVPIHSLIVQKVGYESKQFSMSLDGVKIDFIAAAFVDVSRIHSLVVSSPRVMYARH